MPDDEGLREELAAFGPMRVNVNRPGEIAAWQTGVLHWDDAARIAAVVERHAARRAAEALREAAADMPADDDQYVRRHGLRPVRAWLRHRANILDAGTEPHPAHRHDETETGRG